MLKKLLPFMRPYRKEAILSPLFMVLEAFMDVLIPYLMAFIIDQGISQRDVALVTRYGLFMIAAAILAIIFGVLSTHYGATAGMGFAAEIRQNLFAKIQHFSFKNLDKFSPPSLITRLSSDSTLLGQVGMMSLRMAWRSPFMLILAVLLSLKINSELTLVLVATIPLMILALFFILRKAAPLFTRQQAMLDKLNGAVQENLTSIRVVKSFVRQDHEKQRFSVVNDNLMTVALKGVNVVVLMLPMMMALMGLSIVAILWFGGLKIIAGSMQTGQLLSFIVYMFQIMMALIMLSFFIFHLTRGRASAARILEVLDTELDIESPEGGCTTVTDGSIDFRNVSFTYPGNTDASLQNIDLHIEKSSIFGIIGATGSSKTSLVQLIPRLYEVSSGELLVGGKNVKDYKLSSLRDAVAFVLQKNTLFSGTLRENMLWGKADATDEEIYSALRQARALDFVLSQPDALDYKVEQGGNNFSGGQRQRLCIARALLKKPQIMILDDSTSAVDVATDARIREVFKTELKRMTTIIITQRISSIDHADRILVLDEGRISGLGTHEELLRDNKIYQEVYESQKQGVIGA